MNLDPELIAFVQWLTNQGVAVAALIAGIFIVGRKLDDGNKLLDALLVEQRGNAVLLQMILVHLGVIPPPKA